MLNLPVGWIKIIKTCNLYFCFFVLGLCISLPGPCLLDLQHIVQTDTEHIGIIYTARSIGFLFGSIIGGVILDSTKSKQAIMTIINLLSASLMIVIPFGKDLTVLTGCMVVSGLALGAINTGGNVLCLMIWGIDSGAFYQALHFTFGLGGFVAPLIAAPFLGNYENNYTSNEMSQTSPLWEDDTAHINDFNTTLSTKNTLSYIAYPFIIIGVLGLLTTLIFLAISIVSPTDEAAGKKESSQDSKMSLLLLSTVLILNFFLLFVETGTEIAYSQMLTTYIVKSRLQLSPATGSYMTSVFWAAFTISRLVSIFLALKVSSFTLIISDLIISSIGAFCLLFLASYEWAVWLASVLLGAGIASFFPSAVAWLGTYINVTSKITSVFVVGEACGEMVIPFLISYFIDSVPDVLIYTVPLSCISSTSIVIVLYLLLRKSRRENPSA